MNDVVTGGNIKDLLENPYFVKVITLRAPNTTFAAVAMRPVEKKVVTRVFIYDTHTGIILKKATSGANIDHTVRGFTPASFGFTMAMETNEYFLRHCSTDLDIYRAIVGCDEETLKRLDRVLHGLCCLRRAAQAQTPAAYLSTFPVGQNYWQGHVRHVFPEGDVRVNRKMMFKVPGRGKLETINAAPTITHEARFDLLPFRHAPEDGVQLTLTRYYEHGKWPTLKAFLAEERNVPYVEAFLKEKVQHGK